MPRIADEILECVFYLYPTVADAQAGERAGGTGFFVGVPSETVPGWTYVYAVTNSHVVRAGESPVMRLNTVDGKIDVIELGQDNWKDHPDGDDLAVCQWEPANTHRARTISDKMLLTKEILDLVRIGIGDDVFVVGRFINHEGRQRNQPSVRFGNIAMMPVEPIFQEQRAFEQESFVVESRSLPGYSGAPVFVHIPSFTSRLGGAVTNLEYEWLLGVDWGHNYITEKVRDEGGKEHPEGWQVWSNSGMMNVVPAWRLADFLGRKDFAAFRKKKDVELAKQQKKENGNVLD